MNTKAPGDPVARGTAPAASGRRVLVIGHRGASGYRPEHTLAAYELAARMGADFIEPDVVVTADGHLVCRHEPEISGTTDVAARPEFAHRRTTKVIDGESMTGWFTEDFTLAELRTLRAVERLPQLRPDNTLYDGLFPIPTLTEVMQLRARLSRELGRAIGVYPETKHPTYFAAAGLALEDRLLDVLRIAGLNHPGAPVFVQSFETTNLRWMRAGGLRTRVIQLLADHGAPYDHVCSGDPRTYADLLTPDGLAAVANYADGVGLAKSLIDPCAAGSSAAPPTTPAGGRCDVVQRAHAAGLLVHVYTFRAENAFLPAALRHGDEERLFGDALAEHRSYLAAGVDGVFADHPDIAVLARDLALHPALLSGS